MPTMTADRLPLGEPRSRRRRKESFAEIRLPSPRAPSRGLPAVIAFARPARHSKTHT